MPNIPTREAKVLKGHNGTVQVVRFNSDGSYCLSGGTDKSIKLWNPHKGLLIKSYPGHGYGVRDIAVGADNSKFASCGGDRQPFLWDVGTGRIIRKFRGHDKDVNCIVFNEENTVLITGSYDKTVKIWDCKSNSQDSIQVLDEAKDSVTSIALSGSEIITGSVDGKVRNYDIRTGTLRTDTISQPVTSVNITHDTNCILASCLDDCVRLIDKNSGELLAEYKGHVNNSYKIDSCLSNDDAHVFGGSEDNNIYVWDLVEGRLITKLTGHIGKLCSLSYHPKEPMLVSASSDATVRLWQ
eukprot:Phypoly_transcript_14336.p1 GENE.Phypoly_transcript_14336~~Phypoly_transcript_14336.p1  ORF type:complete len:297 (+),score=30.69 Phypoly_transcript_14336:48-938(+)